MRRTRGQYHFALRCVKSQKQQVKCFKLLEAMFNSDRDFFKEVYKILGFNKYDDSCMDGLKDKELIANQFASQYNELFKPQSHCANLSSRLTPAEKISSTLEQSELGIIWVFVIRSVIFARVLKCLKLSACKPAKNVCLEVLIIHP